MIYSKKLWAVIGCLILLEFILKILDIDEHTLDVFAYGLIVGFILTFLHEKSGLLKKPMEYFNDLDNIMSRFYSACFLTKDISEEYTQTLIDSLEYRVEEFKKNLEWEREKNRKNNL